MTIRTGIIKAIEAAILNLGATVEVEPAGDPDSFPSLAIFDHGHVPLEREAFATRRAMTITIEGYVENVDGVAPTAERDALQAAVVAALMSDETLGGIAELIDDDDCRMMTAVLASRRCLAFIQDFTIQFTTSRIDPAQPA